MRLQLFSDGCSPLAIPYYVTHPPFQLHTQTYKFQLHRNYLRSTLPASSPGIGDISFQVYSSPIANNYV